MSASPLSAAVDARSVRAPVAASLAGKAAEMVTLLALATLVPRALGPADYGQFAVALTVVTLGSLAMVLGGPTLMARYVPAAAPQRREALARALGLRLALGRLAQLGVAGVGAVVLVLVAPSTFPGLETALVMLALALNVVATLALQTGLGLGRTGAWSARWPLQNAVLVVAVLALHPLFGATGALAAIIASSIVACALGVVIVAPLLRGTTEPMALPQGALRFATLQAAGAALVQVAHRGGIVVVALLAGSAGQTGFAALALGVALAATYAVAQLFTVSLPRLAEGEADVGEAVLRRLAGMALGILLPAALVVALVLERLVPLVFGEGFAGAVDAFAPALAFVVLAPVNALVVQAAALRLRPQATLWSALAGVIAFTVVAAAAVPPWEAAGGAAAALAGAVTSALVAMALLPGAVGARLGGASVGGAAAVLAAALVA
ncbi:MAG: hypothetical protein MSC31_15645 [Solirubrobacteraceae bacterium MAG38_C4-C5]|nr:hypothetical protein [Candidatus Siliceabacter maunaloa]